MAPMANRGVIGAMGGLLHASAGIATWVAATRGFAGHVVQIPSR
jgi:hypothetical protein